MKLYKLIGVFILLLLSSCKGQPSTAKIKIVNKSSTLIDSIKIQNPQIEIKDKIDLNQTKTIVDLNQTKTIEANIPVPYPSQESPLLLHIYQERRVFEATWGFCDFGTCISLQDSIFLFDKGISYKNVPPPMPKNFFVYLTNKTGKQIDSIYSEYNAISNIETISKDLRKITLDYKLFSNDPVLIIQTDKKRSCFNHSNRQKN